LVIYRNLPYFDRNSLRNKDDITYKKRECVSRRKSFSNILGTVLNFLNFFLTYNSLFCIFNPFQKRVRINRNVLFTDDAVGHCVKAIENERADTIILG